LNGNNILSRNELIEVLKSLKLNTEFESLLILRDYLDKNGSGRINVNEIVTLAFESVP
jgi:hypothetical protein